MEHYLIDKKVSRMKDTIVKVNLKQGNCTSHRSVRGHTGFKAHTTPGFKAGLNACMHSM